MLLFVDGMSHYTDAFLGEKWDYRDSSANGVAQSLTGGRFGRGRVSFTSTGAAATGQRLQKTYDGSSTIVLGFAVAQTAIQNTDGGWLVFFMDASTIQVGLKIEQSGQIRVFRDAEAGGGVDFTDWIDQTTTFGISTNAISSSAFDFLEVKVISHPTAGEVEILRNGSPFYHLTDLNTAISGVNNTSSIIFGGRRGSSSTVGQPQKSWFDLCDVYLLNTVVNGSDANDPTDFIGDRTWEPLTPTADGADTDWTTTGSADHFANVDEIPPNTSDHNSSATVSDRDGFEVSSPTGPSAASAILAFTMYLQKDTSGSNAVAGFMRSAGAAYENGTEFQVPSPWAFRQSFLATKPGGGAITIGDIGTHQLGYEKTI